MHSKPLAVRQVLIKEPLGGGVSSAGWFSVVAWPLAGVRLTLVCCVLIPSIGLWASSPEPARVWVAAVQARELAGAQTFVGTVMPARRSTVGSAVESRVEEFLVREGDRVSEGQPLVRLRATQLEIRLAAAAAELELRRQELAQAENGSRPEEIQQTRAKMLATKATMDVAQSRLGRGKNLFSQKLVSEEDFQDLVSVAEAAQQTHLEAKAAWELAVAGPRKEQIAQARARWQIAEEEVRRLKDEIAEHTIKASFSGYVTKEHTQVGQWLALGGPVVEIVDVDSVEVETPVLESFVPQLEGGVSARVEIGALPGMVWTGPVSRIVPQADLRSRNFPIKVRLANRPGPGGVLLKPGMFARVMLPVGSKTPVLMVPKDALVLGEAATTVWVLQPDLNPTAAGQGTVRSVPVEVGVGEEDWIAVRGDLKAGELVVTSGNERLVQGQRVIVVKPDKALSGSK